MSRRAVRRLIPRILLVVLVFIGILAFYIYRTMGTAPMCNNPQTGTSQTGLSARQIISNDIERCYLIYVPPTIANPIALNVHFHGFASNAETEISLTRWNDVADSHQFIVIYPQGLSFPARWNSSAEFRSSADDLQFFRDMVADIETLFEVDASQIYVNGISNGGAMAYRIACQASEIVAAVGLVAHTPLEVTNGCEPTRAIPAIFFNGTEDPIINYNGGTYEANILTTLFNISAPLTYVPIPARVAEWAARNECSTQPEMIAAVGDASGISYTECNDNADVIFYTIEGGGHTWPGGSWNMLGNTSTDISASETMWRFFTEHPMISVQSPTPDD